MRSPHAPRRLLPLLLCLALAACGGGGGGDGPGPGGVNLPPSLSVLAPQLGVAALVGDGFAFRYLADDPDDAAAVTLLADADQNPATTGDQTLLHAGVDGNGAQTDATVVVPGLGVGAYALVARVDDGTNPPVEVVLPRPLVVYRGIAGVAAPRSNRYGVQGNTVVFSRGEAEDAAGPLNGDGLADDGVMCSVDAGTGVFTQSVPGVSMDVAGVLAGRVRPLQAEGGVLAWLTLEADENANLNAGNMQSPNAPIGGPDVDQLDALVSFVVPANSLVPTTNTYAGPAAITDVVGGRIVSLYAEAAEGAGGSDRNGDGDSLDAFFAYVDPTVLAGPFEFLQTVFFTAPPLPAAGPVFRHAGPLLAGYVGTEIGAPVGADFNGDGDGADDFLVLVDFSTLGGAGAPGTFRAMAGFSAAPANPPMPVDRAAAFGVNGAGFAAYYAQELANNLGGLAGTDINGDGVIGHVAMLYDLNTQANHLPVPMHGPINSIPACPDLVYDATRVFFSGIEAPRLPNAPGTNSDGDVLDLRVLYWMDHTVMPTPVAQTLAVNFGGGIPLTALALDGGGSVTQLAPGWLAVVVNELANGGFDINGSGAVDLAYLLVDTATNPAPTVYNPGIVPSAAGTFPLTGVHGEDPGNADQGVFVRLTEAQNGDLDGDMNATETFLAYISFNAPTTVVRLDTGGDHVAVADGMIAITANEALTGSDFDGNGAMTDHVFRVLDFAGTPIEAGRLCSILSVPVTETGQVFVYLRDEIVEGRVLNGDGDQIDTILGIWTP